MKTIKNFLLLSLFALLGSCVDAIDVNIDRDESLVVIEGFVTTEQKEHLVKITRSAKYGTIFEGAIRNVVGAEVLLRDQEGNVTQFVEKTSGRYYTPADFQAVVGNTYTLEIITLNGESYFSYPEKVPPVAEIEDIIPVFRTIPTSNEEIFRSGVEIYSQFQDPDGEKNYYWWELGGTYFIKTFPENFTIRPPFSLPVAAPKDCCAECWVTEEDIDISIKIANDFLTDGSLATELTGFLEDDGFRFNEKYLVRVKQYSQTKEAHQFFKLLNDQLSIDGDIFDAPPAQIRGNFYKLDDFEQAVLGYFWIGDMKTDSIFIEKESLELQQPLKEFNDDCRVLDGATIERPLYW